MKSRLSFAILVCSVALALLFFTAGAPAANAQIQVLAADPPSAEQGTVNLNVLIKGRGFKKGAVAKWFVTGTTDTGGVRVNSTAFVDAATLRANIDVSDMAVLSKYDIVVMNSDGRTGKGIELFTVNKKGVSACTAPPLVPEGGTCFSSVPGIPGCLDSSFGGGTGRVLGPRNLQIWRLGMQTAGTEQKIVAFGNGVTSGDPCVEGHGAIVRYLADGTLDPSFGAGGVLYIADGVPLSVGQKGMVVQPDNKIVLVGQKSIQVPAQHGNKPATLLVPAVARYTQDGSPDPDFGNGGVVSVPFGTYQGYMQAVALQSDGKIVATGLILAGGQYVAVLRLLPNGQPDTTFNGTGTFVYTSGSPAAGNALAIQEFQTGQGVEQRIVVAGQAVGSYGYMAGIVLRFTPSGQLDTSFGGSGVVLGEHQPLPDNIRSGSFEGVAIDSQNRIVATGPLTGYTMQMARYDESGNLDSSFGEGGFFLPPNRYDNENPWALAIQPDDHILAVGVTGDGDSRVPTVWRITPGGAYDPSFGDNGWIREFFVSYGAGFGHAIMLQPDGKFIIGGRAPYVFSGGIGYFGAALARYWQ